MTTTETITAAQIAALRTEAAEAGDTDTVADCDRCLADRLTECYPNCSTGAQAALERVVEVIAQAEAMVGA